LIQIKPSAQTEEKRPAHGKAEVSANDYADDLTASVRYALETTRAIAACPLPPRSIRVGNDAAESRAFERAKRIVKSDGTTWKSKALAKEIYLARCALNLQFFDGWVELQRHCP
jgi:hypothetical protein